MTAETAGQASPGEASFQLLAEHLPDVILFAFDADLRMWAATGGAIRARGWTSEEFIGMTVPEIAGGDPGRGHPRLLPGRSGRGAGPARDGRLRPAGPAVVAHLRAAGPC